MTAAYGSSFVESSFTASRANSKAFVRARREDGFTSAGVRDSGGDSNSRSGTISCCWARAREEAGGSMERGGGSDRLSEDDAADSWGLFDTEVFRCEKAATAARFTDGAGRINELCPFRKPFGGI
jgi:hypothetical protein